MKHLAKLFTSKKQWTKGYMQRGNANCLIGRIYHKFSILNSGVSNARLKIMAAILSLYPGNTCISRGSVYRVSIIGFNDHRKTNYKMITKVCRFASRLSIRQARKILYGKSN